MSSSKHAESLLTAERFAEVCTTTRWHVRTALDLIFIHNEKEVRGRQPRASLNPLTVLSVVAAYERFFDDLYAAAMDEIERDRTKKWRSGHSQNEIGRIGPKKKRGPRKQWLPESLGELLREEGIVSNLTSYWVAWMTDGWFGASPTDWAFRKYSEDPEAFEHALQDARHARDGAAHFILPKTAARAAADYEPIPIADGLFAKKLRNRGKTGWNYGWDSDAKSDTVQAGFARGATAFFIQLIDSSIVAVADEHSWSAEKHRLPTGWFAAEVPGSDSRYAGAQFWGGQALHRVSSTRAQGNKQTR